MPAPDGWRVGGLAEDAVTQPARTMEEAAAAVPDGATLRLSLPVSAVLMERMRLPSTDRGELGSMVVLQLEKTLPYGGEELTSGFEVIQQEENESDLLAFAVSNEQLDGLCEPLRSRHKLPDEVTVFAIQLAAKFPGEEVLALIFREADATILAIAQRGKLVAAHACAAVNREQFTEELPRLLLAAELEGAPVNFSKVVVERDLADWLDSVKMQFTETPVLLVPVDGPMEPGPLNLVPATWTLEQQSEARKAKVRDWLALAGAIYLVLLLMAAGYIIWLTRQVNAIDAQVQATGPSVDTIGHEKTRWTALQPAIDPSRFTLEVLQQIYKSIPSDDLKVTIFDYTPTAQFMIEGEAANGNLAIQYADALKANPALKDFNFESPAPDFLPNEHAHFRIFGKL